MRKRLTDATVKSLKPKPTDFVVMDEVTPGLGIRVRAKGHRAYFFRGRLNGTDTGRLDIADVGGVTLAGARAIAQSWAELLKLGKHPREEQQRLAEEARQRLLATSQQTVGQLAEDFLAGPARGKRRAAAAEANIRRDFKTWWHRSVPSIRRSDAEALIEAVARRGTTGALARNILSLGRRMFGWATDTEARRIRYGIEYSPFAQLKSETLTGPIKIRTRVLDDDELRAVWRAAGRLGYPYGPIVRLLLLTGCRHNEVAGARWREFDLHARIWTIPAERFKMNTQHRVPLTDDMVALLEELPRWNGGDFLFSMSGGAAAYRGSDKAKRVLDKHVLHIWRVIGRTKGIDRRTSQLARWVPHDLRRTCRSRLAALQVSEPVAEAVIGHSPRGLIRIYNQHRYEAEIRAALEAWNALLRSIVDPRPGNERGKILRFPAA